MSGWRTAWRNLTRAIQCPACGKLQKPAKTCRNKECSAEISKVKSPTHGLRFHDLRHHAITELAESDASDQTIMAIAGHVSPKMLAHYSHVRLEAKRWTLDALSGRVKEAVTTQGASQNNDEVPQVLENLVDVRGFEPLTPCLQSGEPNLLNLAGADANRQKAASCSKSQQAVFLLFVRFAFTIFGDFPQLSLRFYYGSGAE